MESPQDKLSFERRSPTMDSFYQIYLNHQFYFENKK